jgi:hypothetical protein
MWLEEEYTYLIMKHTKIQKITTYLGYLLAVFYMAWFLYERFTCIGCWGNDIFFAIPTMALVPASLEENVVTKYIVVFVNAGLIFVAIYLFGKILDYLIKSYKK